MGRYTGPVCRFCRRDGAKLFLKATRCYTAKCPVETGRPPPGMHGQRRGRKQSEYAQQLRAKQQLRRMYGLQEGQFRLFFERVLQRRGVTGLQLLQALETRLDNVVYRLGFASSRRSARQLVTHGHVLVNGRRADIPSLVLSVGAVVSIKDVPRSRTMVAKNLELTQSRSLAPWLALDAKNFSGQLLRIPTREEIAPIVDEQLVVEFYSK